MSAPAQAMLAEAHVDALVHALSALRADTLRIGWWGSELASRLAHGHRLLAAGNGGSAAQAQHLSAELVGKFDEDRAPFSALALHTDTSAVTSIGNDYGFEQVYARQVRAHARAGDVVLLLSTSGHSANLLAAATEAHLAGATCWALTGAAPNPLCGAADDALTVPGCTATVQEAHLVALHLLCRSFDAALASVGAGVSAVHG